MSIHETNQRSSASSSAWALAMNPLVAVFLGVERILTWRRELAELSKLDDALLKDIGLSRADVERAHAMPVGADPWRLLDDVRGRS
jgi:uncharacterized protein YjiS (DUF1127 family)